MKKIIIGIHGLGNKPPKNILSEWWKAAIIEGLKKYNYSAGDFNFEMVYWADILNKEPLNPEVTDKKNSLYISEKYIPEEIPIPYERTGIKQKAIGYVEKYYDKFIVNEIISLKHPALTEIFIHFNLKEVEAYFSSRKEENNGKKLSIKESIISRLAETLKRHHREDILLITHSMGAIIAHDALHELGYTDINIDTLVTIGSPLGQQYVLNVYREEEEKKLGTKFIVPKSIRKAWYNFSDINDHVAINHYLGEIYKENDNKIKITDEVVQNNYSSSGILNPHKSYGYLRTPEVAAVINSFLIPKKFHFLNWFKRKPAN